MEIRINVTTFKYIGETPYTFKASNFKTYIFKKGDLITLEDNHYAHFLRKKSDFIELCQQEKSKTAKKQEPQSQKQENESQKESQAKAQAQDSKTPEA